MTHLGPVTAVVLGGGAGSRFGSETPKQFFDLAGRPMFHHCLEALSNSPEVDAIVLVLPASGDEFESYEGPKMSAVVSGGATRQDSLSEGLVCIAEEVAVVLVHDAARPLLTPNLVSKVLAGLGPGVDGAIAALPVEDALKEVSADGLLLGGRPRAGVWRAQTPQAFIRDVLEDALVRSQAEGRYADDCSEMVIRAGGVVRAVPGDPANVKVTTAADLRLCESLLAGKQPQTSGSEVDRS